MDKSPEFFEVITASNFSFLRGASHPEEIAVAASRLGLSGFALCDRNTVAGVVRAHMAAKEAGLRFQPGSRLVFTGDTPDIAVWPRNVSGWNNLCRLLTAGNRRAPKGACWLSLDDLTEWGGDMSMAVLPALPLDGAGLTACEATLATLKQRFGPAVRLALASSFLATSSEDTERIAALGEKAGVALLATNDVLYHRAERRKLQDVVTCIREHITLAEAGRLLEPNGERHLKSGQEMARLLKAWPQAIAETAKLFSELDFSLDELRHQYPEERPANGLTHRQELARLAYEGARTRYPDGAPKKILADIEHELALIGELEYEPYFLTVHDIVRFARSEGILCQGRGSAANSTVCYCLAITDVDPSLTDLLFERFISPERREPPDIDVDFEHERREEVIQYIYEKYGRDHAALTGAVITYRARSAAREVGKVFGLSEDAVSGLSGAVWGHSSGELGEREASQGGLDITDPVLAQILELANEINGFPRHLSQHSGGFVITRDRLDTIIPVMNTAMEERTQVEWDKDDLESLGILKIDILALGMLTCLRKAFNLLADHYDRPLTLASMEKEDPRTYAMIQRADTIGVFQIESRAQMSMLPRLKPRNFYDLVIEVAIVRPGPIQGDMVHPYLRRRQGKEKAIYPSKELEAVLSRTLGVPLFQEQAMKIAIVAAGFSPGEADKLRRAMATFRRVGTIHTFHEKMVRGMTERGYDPDFATRCFRQIEGFGEYGFPESHAASFALLVYASCWLKCHYPDVFAAAIINSQPMGFYSPAQLVRDAREHGVEVRPPDINWSDYDCTLEPGDHKPNGQVQPIHPRHGEMARDIRATHAVRLGLRKIKGMGEDEAALVTENRSAGYTGVRDLWLRAGLSRHTMEKLADADAFGSIGLTRRQALWQVRGLDEGGAVNDLPAGPGEAGEANADCLPLFAQGENRYADLREEPPVVLPQMPASEEVIQDYRTLSLSLKAHPVSFLRTELAAAGIVPTAQLEGFANGRWAEIAGLVAVRQRPGSAKGVVFMTLEDETGIANIIVWPKTFETFRVTVMSSRLVRIRGRLQKADGVTHLVADRLTDITPMLVAHTEQGIFDANQGEMIARALDFGGLANADEVKNPIEDVRQIKSPLIRTRQLLRAADKSSRPLKQPQQMRLPWKTPPGRRRKAVKRTAAVLPKGRNFH